MTASPVQQHTPPAPAGVKEVEDESLDRTKEEAEPCVNGDEPSQSEVRQRMGGLDFVLWWVTVTWLYLALSRVGACYF